MSAADVDVVVVGGGLAGTAVLRDLARRGARAVLFEKGDLVAGGSLAAQATIDPHDLGLDASADRTARAARTREASILVAIAPHLASETPVISVVADPRRGASLLARWDALLALRARGGEKPDRSVLDARTARAREPGLALDDDRGALLTRRVRLDAHRLGVALARDAVEQGAELRLRDEVLSIATEGARLRVVARGGELVARAVVVATGAWPAPGGAPRARERRVHLVIGHALLTHAVACDDGTVVPFHDVTVVSGTGAAWGGAGAGDRVTRDEVRALLAKLGRVVPDVREARVDAAYASVRRSAAEASEPPLYTMPIGTPWNARARAADVGARIGKTLGLETPNDLETAKLPGGESVEDSFVAAERLAIPEATARRVVLRHGARTTDIGARIGKRRTEASVVCACGPVLEAEVRHAVRAEHARDVCDVGRRTSLGHGACGGMRCAHRAAEIVAAERVLSPREAHEMARRFLVDRWRARAPALDPASLAQEELACARWSAASLLGDGDAE